MVAEIYSTFLYTFRPPSLNYDFLIVQMEFGIFAFNKSNLKSIFPVGPVSSVKIYRPLFFGYIL
jgi:hypothetical protein